MGDRIAQNSLLWRNRLTVPAQTDLSISKALSSLELYLTLSHSTELESHGHRSLCVKGAARAWAWAWAWAGATIWSGPVLMPLWLRVAAVSRASWNAPTLTCPVQRLFKKLVPLCHTELHVSDCLAQPFARHPDRPNATLARRGPPARARVASCSYSSFLTASSPRAEKSSSYSSGSSCGRLPLRNQATVSLASIGTGRRRTVSMPEMKQCR